MEVQKTQCARCGCIKPFWVSFKCTPGYEHSEKEESEQKREELATVELEEKDKKIEESAGTEASSSSTLRQTPAEDGGVEETGKKREKNQRWKQWQWINRQKRKRLVREKTKIGQWRKKK